MFAHNMKGKMGFATKSTATLPVIGVMQHL